MATKAWQLEGAAIGEGEEIANSLAARVLIMQAKEKVQLTGDDARGGLTSVLSVTVPGGTSTSTSVGSRWRARPTARYTSLIG
jgi:hypothetical protein